MAGACFPADFCFCSFLKKEILFIDVALNRTETRFSKAIFSCRRAKLLLLDLPSSRYHSFGAVLLIYGHVDKLSKKSGWLFEGQSIM